MLLLIELFKSAIQEFLVLAEEKFEELFDKFLSSLPSPVKGLLFRENKVLDPHAAYAAPSDDENGLWR